jgi:type II secretory pathway component PulJ
MWLPFVGCVFLLAGSLANVFVAVSRNLTAQQKLEADIEQAEGVLAETLARLARLRTQRRTLRERSSALFSRGMRDVDEADGVRSQEDALLAEQQAVGEAQLSGAVDMIDWSVILGSASDPVSSSAVVDETPSEGVARG